MTEGELNLGDVEMPATPDAPVALVSVWEGESFGEPVPVAVSELQTAEEPEAARVYGKPKRKPAKRAAQPSGRRLRRGFCKTGPGGGIDNSCGSGKGGGGVAKAGNGPLVKAARDEHKKALDKLRKTIANAQDKAYEKWIEKAEVHGALQARLNDHLSLVDKMSSEHESLVNQVVADPTNESLAEQMRESGRELLDERVAIEPLEKAEAKARKERDKARYEERNAVAIALAKEAASVDKEDGFTASDRNRSVKAIEDTHASGSQISEWAQQQGLDDSVALSQQSYASDARREAQEFLRSAVNPMIHTKALECPIEYKEGVRANATGTVFEYDDGSGSGLVGRVQLSPTDHYSTVIHEFGHQIEHGNLEAAKLCGDFLSSRVKDESPVSFSEKFSGVGYGTDEIGSADDFGKAVSVAYGKSLDPSEAERIAYYAGKKYAGQGQTKNGLTTHGATEVLSIGMELMARDARAFAKADPEWFDLVAGISTGRILTKTRRNRRSN
jgi:hypothetical protein